MQRFCRSHLLCIWCCATLVVFSYVLFDLLDIDGSDFSRLPGNCTVADERLVCEEAHRHVGPGPSPVRLPPQDDRWMSLQLSSTPTVRIQHPLIFHSRPRGALSLPSTGSRPLNVDPAGPVADL